MKVWYCKIVVDDGTEIPNGFDCTPRRAAINAVESSGIEVLACFSGWAGKLNESEAIIVDRIKQDGK